MRNRVFFAISCAAGTGLLLACTSFSAPSDGTGTDGGAADGGGEDGVAADGTVPAPQPVRRCMGNARFEDAFDDRTIPELGWNLAPGANIALDDSGVPGGALRIETPAMGSGGSENHSMSRSIDLGGDRSVCVELDLFLDVDTIALTGDAFAELVKLSPSNGDDKLFIEFRSGGLGLTRGGDPFPLAKSASRKWQHLVLKIPSGGEPSLEIDGAFDVVTAPGPTAPSASIEVALGLYTEGRGGTATAIRVRIDNFRFVTSP